MFHDTDRSELSPRNQALLRLGQVLTERGYRFTTVTPLTHARINRRPENAMAEDLAGVFGWSRPFVRATLDEELFGLMEAADVLQAGVDGFRSKVRWSSLGDELYVHSSHPTEEADAVFFGPDTYRFVQAIDAWLDAHADREIRRVADIGCGSGAAAIHVARRCPAACVQALDINLRALEFTRINACLAGTTAVRAIASDLLRQAEGSFDLIVANPPYLLDPAQRTYRHGGGELGSGLSLAILDDSLGRLAPGGTLLLYTGAAMVAGRDPLRERVVDFLGGSDYRWHYRELDPDVFGEELEEAAYAGAERIAAVLLTVQRPCAG
ncbi:N5-glutamine methyltransferase family protein [Pseudomonas jinjuensis]|uniref:Methylase of polypeptide chain release factors n=1 Tax=Pseudomonas jinjuensis TaxID=198616 RepID=A0A1H0EBI3_9PSED|nr:class I SAM-dependent methyltransferase [Pseudomonas jinjuensis]SDN79730.1 Methylase of polypeptide chain release factors [Pseudomonas jinjuensis]